MTRRARITVLGGVALPAIGGATVLTQLYRLNREAGNCFGETLPFELEHSGLSGTISQKQIIYFHDDPTVGRVLRPQHPLTYAALRGYDFDANAEILLALDVAGR